MKRVH